MREITKTELELINIIRKSDDPATMSLYYTPRAEEFRKIKK